jgi:hypothetical protein
MTHENFDEENYLDFLAAAGDRLKRAALDMRETGWTAESRLRVTEALGAVAFAEGALVAGGVLDNDAIQLARDIACSEEAFS